MRADAAGLAGRLKLEEITRELARRAYPEYLAYTGGKGWLRTRLSVFLAESAQRFIEEEGPAPRVLVIQTAPQHGKTASITEALPSWYLGAHPSAKVIIASYNEVTAERFMRRNAEKLRKYGPAVFGLDGSFFALSRSGELETAQGGRLISRGIMSGVTGNSADLIIVDDPIKNRLEADSETRRRRLWEEWVSSLKTRLSAGGRAIVVMTPWHEDDLSGRLLKYEPGARLLRLPVEAEEGDPMGRRPGEPLCPELGKDAAWLEGFRGAYLADPQGGRRAWDALFMCRPRTEGGNLVPRSWWRFYDRGEVAAFATELISVDASFKGGDGSDFVAITVWGKLGSDYYLRYCLNRRMDFPDTVRAIRAVRALYPAALAVLVEDKANGSAIIATLQRELFVIPVDPRGGKEARAAAVAPAIESGHVFLPRDAAWTEDFIEQWARFPRGAHDDMVDSASQALTYMLFSRGEPLPDDAAEDEGLDWLLGGGVYDVYGKK
jgi:predicted phage terminase large subunit-like protein